MVILGIADDMSRAGEQGGGGARATRKRLISWRVGPFVERRNYAVEIREDG